MFAKLLFSTAVAILSLAISVERVNAMGAMHCEISVDGQKVFRGVISQGPGESNYEALGSITAATIMADWNGPYAKGPYQDIELKGKVEFAVFRYRTMQLESLRLVYSPFEFQGRVSPEWIIHQEDAAQIKAFYQPVVDGMRRSEQIGIAIEQWWPTVVITIFGLVVLIAPVFIGYYVYRRVRTRLNASAVQPG